MFDKKTLSQQIGEHKTLFVIIGIILLLIEIEVFALAAMKSGKKSTLQVLDDKSVVIYETDGDNLSDFDKYYFEKTFGPLDQYRVRLNRYDEPFPFRAWFAAAVGIPLGGILLFAFVVKAYSALFIEQRKEAAENEPEGRLERIGRRIGKLNIFLLGGIVFLGVLAFWAVPNLLIYIGHVGVETIERYKWFIVGLLLVLLGVVVWIIYLRYLLAKKSIESRAEVEKYRMRLEYTNPEDSPRQLSLQRDGESDAEGGGPAEKDEKA